MILNVGVFLNKNSTFESLAPNYDAHYALQLSAYVGNQFTLLLLNSYNCSPRKVRLREKAAHCSGGFLRRREREALRTQVHLWKEALLSLTATPTRRGRVCTSASRVGPALKMQVLWTRKAETPAVVGERGEAATFPVCSARSQQRR